jgi:raffinose/stachyose/melibiose transport system substrate-binding protein
MVIRRAVLVCACAVFSLALGASEARPDASDSITMLAFTTNQQAFQVLIPNFERVYPNITVNATYVPSGTAISLEPTELAAGSAPDIITDFPGSETPYSTYRLWQGGYLAPFVNVPWAKRSLPLMTSLSKVGPVLYTFEPQIAPYGAFTNDTLFAKLGLKVPQTFPQLLALCQKAKAAGTSAIILDVSNSAMFIRALAIPLVYGSDRHWGAEMKAGKVTFSGSAGWRQALQEYVQMYNAGCFQPGVTGSSQQGAEAAFAEGQGLMFPFHSGVKGSIDALDPQFSYSFVPFPSGTSANQTATFLHISSGLSINSHASAQNQAAALTFINFVARPKQDALYTQITGGATAYQFQKDQLPSFMSAFSPVVANNRYIVDPAGVWTGTLGLAASQSGVGLLTGQLTIDGVLSSMDAALNASSTG